jgi:hypothetical protein
VAIRGFFQRFLSSAAAVAVVLGVVHLDVPAQTATAGSSSFVRGIYGTGASDVAKAAGFNTINVVSPSRASLDSLAAKGFKAVVWLGEYDRTARCQFEFSDASVRATVAAVAGHPAIAAYQLSDEPNYARLHCPSAVQQHRDRAALIKSVDPSKPTYLTISTWDGREGYPYEYFAGVADIMGLDVYPCTYSGGCNFGIIDTAIRQAASKGVSRVWAIVQDFADGYYRVPTAGELRTQFERWVPGNLEGYFVYSWTYGNIANRTDHLSVLADVVSLFDGSALPVAPAPAPTVTTSSSPKPPPVLSPTPLPIPSAITDLLPGVVAVRELFGGDGAGWGSADLGGRWSTVAGQADGFSRAASHGVIATPANGVTMAAVLDGISLRDLDATVTLRLPNVTGGNAYGYVLLRRASSASNMRIGLYVTPSGAVFIRGQDAGGTSLFSDVPTGLIVSGGEALRLRVVATGSNPTTIKARVWKAAGSEPSTWAVNATTRLSGVQGPGLVGVRTINYSGAAVDFVFDDLVVRAA